MIFHGVGGVCRVGGRSTVEPRARWPVWPGRRCVPGIVAPDSWGARGAECLPRDVLRHSSPVISTCDGTTARRCLCLRTGSGTTEARPPESSAPPATNGGLGVLSCHPANSGPDFRSRHSQDSGDVVVHYVYRDRTDHLWQFGVS